MNFNAFTLSCQRADSSKARGYDWMWRHEQNDVMWYTTKLQSGLKFEKGISGRGYMQQSPPVT